MTSTSRRNPGTAGFLITCMGIGVICVVALLLLAAGYPSAASLVSNVGTLAWFMLILAWIALFDSRRRWPNSTFLARLGSVMSFRR